MEIQIAYDEQLLHRYYARDKWVFFRIYCVHEGQAFPSDQWLDFGLTMLSTWLQATLRLLKGARDERLPFFDGPFWLSVYRKGDTLKVHLYRAFVEGDTCLGEWQLSLDDFVREIVRASKQIHTDLWQRGINRGINRDLLDQVQSLCPKIEELLAARQQLGNKELGCSRESKGQHQKRGNKKF